MPLTVAVPEASAAVPRLNNLVNSCHSPHDLRRAGCMLAPRPHTAARVMSIPVHCHALAGLRGPWLATRRVLALASMCPAPSVVLLCACKTRRFLAVLLRGCDAAWALLACFRWATRDICWPTRGAGHDCGAYTASRRVRPTWHDSRVPGGPAGIRATQNGGVYAELCKVAPGKV